MEQLSITKLEDLWWKALDRKTLTITDLEDIVEEVKTNGYYKPTNIHTIEYLSKIKYYLESRDTDIEVNDSWNRLIDTYILYKKQYKRLERVRRIAIIYIAATTVPMMFTNIFTVFGTWLAGSIISGGVYAHLVGDVNALKVDLRRAKSEIDVRHKTAPEIYERVLKKVKADKYDQAFGKKWVWVEERRWLKSSNITTDG